MSTPSKPAPVTKETLKAFKARSDEIIRAVVARSMQLPEQVAAHGDKADRLLSSGLRYTTLGLQTAMALHNIVLLDWQLSWADQRLRHDGVMPEHILSMLQIYAQVVAELLPPDQAEAINQYVNWMIVRQTELMASSAPPAPGPS